MKNNLCRFLIIFSLFITLYIIFLFFFLNDSEEFSSTSNVNELKNEISTNLVPQKVELDDSNSIKKELEQVDPEKMEGESVNKYFKLVNGVMYLKNTTPPNGLTYTDDPIIIEDFQFRDYVLNCPIFNFYFGESMSKKMWCIVKNNIKKYGGNYFCFVIDMHSDFIVPYEQVVNIRVNFTKLFDDICPSYWDHIWKYKSLGKKGLYTFVSHLSDFVRFHFAKELKSTYYDTDHIILKENYRSPRSFIVKQSKYVFSSPFNFTAEMCDYAMEVQCKNLERWEVSDYHFWGSVGPIAATEVYHSFESEIDLLNKDLFQCEMLRISDRGWELTEDRIEYAEKTCVCFHVGNERMLWTFEDVEGLMYDYFFRYVGYNVDNDTSCVLDLDENLYTDVFSKEFPEDTITNFEDNYRF